MVGGGCLMVGGGSFLCGNFDGVSTVDGSMRSYASLTP